VSRYRDRPVLIVIRQRKYPISADETNSDYLSLGRKEC
jgi:hypothetical protein